MSREIKASATSSDSESEEPLKVKTENSKRLRLSFPLKRSWKEELLEWTDPDEVSYVVSELILKINHSDRAALSFTVSGYCSFHPNKLDPVSSDVEAFQSSVTLGLEQLCSSVDAETLSKNKVTGRKIVYTKRDIANQSYLPHSSVRITQSSEKSSICEVMDFEVIPKIENFKKAFWQFDLNNMNFGSMHGLYRQEDLPNSVLIQEHSFTGFTTQLKRAAKSAKGTLFFTQTAYFRNTNPDTEQFKMRLSLMQTVAIINISSRSSFNGKILDFLDVALRWGSGAGGGRTLFSDTALHRKITHQTSVVVSIDTRPSMESIRVLKEDTFSKKATFSEISTVRRVIKFGLFSSSISDKRSPTEIGMNECKRRASLLLKIFNERGLEIEVLTLDKKIVVLSFNRELIDAADDEIRIIQDTIYLVSGALDVSEVVVSEIKDAIIITTTSLLKATVLNSFFGHVMEKQDNKDYVVNDMVSVTCLGL